VTSDRPPATLAAHFLIREEYAMTRFVRELGYLTVGLATSIVSFGLVVGGLIASIVLAPFLVGFPVSAAVARVVRGVADVDRRNARLLIGRPLRGDYRSTTGRGFVEWVSSTLGDRQTWRDLSWSTLHSLTGFAFGVAALTMIAVVVGVATLPFWYWSVPNPDVIGLWHSNTLPKALAVVPFAIPALLAAMGVTKLMAAIDVRLATVLLDRRDYR
jgi:hypothetical protein